MRASFLSAPRPLIEAARIDGANSWRIHSRVLLPLAVPAITTMIVLVFMFTWNDFLLPLTMVGSSPAHQTAPLGLANFQSRYGTDVPDLAAGALLVALPVMAVYVLLQRRVIRGIVQGAVKG